MEEFATQSQLSVLESELTDKFKDMSNFANKDELMNHFQLLSLQLNEKLPAKQFKQNMK